MRITINWVCLIRGQLRSINNLPSNFLCTNISSSSLLLAFLMAQHQEKKIGFKSVRLFKDQTLGIGSYGAVCKAKCDDLLCAAKILHPTLFDPTAQLQVSPKQEHRLPIKRFEQECEFLSTIRHPNIVQYLCMHQDPDTGLPVLLMELMDESLTHFLENSPQPIAYHVQANICHDITLALSFLHSNGIIHRDLSSNNVLLRGNILAKVTDFGMAKLGDLNPQATRYTFTMCPGTDVYMPPEAVKDEPVYTEKIDCFSFGVIIVQMLTQQFPKPGNRRQEIQINHPGVPQGLVEVRVAEVDRRQNHISQVDPNHPLLPIALDCLKDKDIERPSAQQLCERVASLRERPQYSDSVAGAQQESQQLRQQLQQLLQASAREREEYDRQLGQIRQQLQQEYLQKTLQIGQQLQTSELERAKLEEQLYEKDRQLHELERQSRDQKRQEAAEKVDWKDNIKLVWREGEKAPFAYKRWCDAVINGNRVYFCGLNLEFWTYEIYGDKGWSRLPNRLYISTTLAILSGLPTTIGGSKPLTNKLMSLTVEGVWTENFPPMQTKRMFVTAECTGTALIVAGGVGEGYKMLTTVEVLNIENRQWSTAVGLPATLMHRSATVCGDQLYVLGGQEATTLSKSVYTCSVSALLQTCTPRSTLEDCTSALSLSNSKSGGTGVWSKLPDLPVRESTCVTFCGRLFAVGGLGSDRKSTTAVYMYNPSTNSWNVISHMTTARRNCFAVILPDNQLMVVGGETEINNTRTCSDSVEFGSLI